MVARLLFVVHVSEDGANGSDDGGFVGEDADKPAAAFGLFVDPLERVHRTDLHPARAGEAGGRNQLGLAGIHQCGDLRQFLGEQVAGEA